MAFMLGDVTVIKRPENTPNNNGYEIELFEEEIFTVPFKVYITVFKNSKKGS